MQQKKLISNEVLEEWVVSHVERYIKDLDGEQGLPVYEMIVMATEKPLLKWAMEKCSQNQKAAAKLLGINRNTLHKKLVIHGFLNNDF